MFMEKGLDSLSFPLPFPSSNDSYLKRNNYDTQDNRN